MSLQDAIDYRLPTNVTPIHYDLTLRTDLDTSRFYGTVEIDLKINEDTSRIVLNAAELHIKDVSVARPDEQIFIPVTQSFDKKNERATFHFPTMFPVDSIAKLHITFEGELAQTLSGYYRSSWKNEAGESSSDISKKPTSARHAFPCWDEPALKATFAMNMVSIDNTVNLFNMPAFSEESYDASEDLYGLFPSAGSEQKNKSWKITRFGTTPKMSTYIVAYANGRFDHMESTYISPLTGDTIPLRIYAPPAKIHQCRFALNVTARVLALYEKVFDIAYPLPKLDTVVADAVQGAMENWGLIIGCSNSYCVDLDTGSVREKQNIVQTQSHEIAHMWFGNITTMEWWTYLYLNEEWKLSSKFVSYHLDAAFNLDSQLSAHPVEVDCADANSLGQIFDALSYSKAAAVLRMLAEYVGEEKFLKGVSMYLKDHLYSTSVTQDLWKGISAATGIFSYRRKNVLNLILVPEGIDVSEMMKNYITKPGYPMLTVTENENGIHVRQDRFLKTGLAKGSDNETIWHVPLNIKAVTSSGDVKADNTTLREREADFALDTKLPFKLNGGSTGYCRILYSQERLEAIVNELTKENSSFNENDRLGILQDVVAFAKAGIRGFGSALSTMLKFQNCREYLPWNVIASEWFSMSSLWWENPRVHNLLDDFGKASSASSSSVIKNLGYDISATDSPDTALLRECALRHALLAGDKDVAQKLRNLFDRFMKNGDYEAIPSGMEEAVYTAAIRYGGLSEYEAVRKIIEDNRSPNSRRAAMLAICATEDSELTQKTVKYMLEDAKPQDLSYLFRGLSQNIKTRKKLVEVFKDRYDDLYAKFDNNFGIGPYVKLVFSRLSTGEDYRQTKAFFEVMFMLTAIAIRTC
ncbi:Aminopeptidase 2 mitochondrial [Paramarasmius palmivorus]|uniref:Aminopeptidase n=1 Tax=Paramarasmius palmivorus TaxID=297713 RepID=A0AAW0D7B5_9AGAR